MKITKYEHSCLMIEEQGKRLIIDPGKFSDSLKDFSNVDAVVVTHVHSDHLDEDKLKSILSSNPKCQIFSTEQVAGEAQDIKITAVKAGQTLNVGSFKLEFFGGDHELYNDFQNVAVLVNDRVYQPGDSYTLPNKEVELLCAPASAPWLRVSEASEFIKSVKAKIVIPIHNSLLSEIGESIHYRILSEAAESVGSTWKVLKPSESIEI